MFLLILCLCFRIIYGFDFIFDLSNYNPNNKTTTIQIQQTTLNVGHFEGQISNISLFVGFYIIQIHTKDVNVTLSMSNQPFKNNSVIGSHIGLVYFTNNTPSFFVFNEKYPTEAMLVVTIYTEYHPIPGGCNLSLNTEIAPYQLTYFDNNLIYVKSQPASFKNLGCNIEVAVDFYHMYIYHNDEYFETLQKMLTVEDIKIYGNKVNKLGGYYGYRKFYNNYNGLGQIFAIISTYNGSSSAYVSSVSNGCDNFKIDGICSDSLMPLLDIHHLAVICYGYFMCYYGHKHLKKNFFLNGFVVGLFIAYVVLSIPRHFTFQEITTFSTINGIVYGLIWYGLWKKYGKPLFSMIPSLVIGGFLMSSLIFYFWLGDTSFYASDLMFGLTIACIIMIFFLIFSKFPFHSHILLCAFIGGYSVTLGLTYYFGGHFQYILINSYRRMTVKEFAFATIDPPYQSLDIIHTILWIILSVTGFYYQRKENKARPPFARPNVFVQEGFDENTPLIYNQPVF